MLCRARLAATGLAATGLLATTARAEPPPPAAPDEPAAPNRLTRWLDRWETGNTRWHLDHVHPLLLKHVRELLGPEDGGPPLTVLFPLCGASVDLGYVARRGHLVVGVDGAPGALDELLSGYGREVEAAPARPGEMRVRVAQAGWWQQVAADRAGRAENRSFAAAPLLLGVEADFLALDLGSAAREYGLGSVDAAFDRGSCVALDPADRDKYAQVLTSFMAPGGRLLLVAVEHEPAFGPPHSVDEAEVRRLFGGAFDIRVLSREPRLEAEPTWRQRGATRFDEVAYMCTRRKG